MDNFDIPTPVGFALDRLHESGFPAYVVGGCVRDHLMHRTPGDYDITTAATPEQTIAVFADCRVVETGLQHGTVTLVRGGMNIEITTSAWTVRIATVVTPKALPLRTTSPRISVGATLR